MKVTNWWRCRWRWIRCRAWHSVKQGESESEQADEYESEPEHGSEADNENSETGDEEADEVTHRTLTPDMDGILEQ